MRQAEQLIEAWLSGNLSQTDLPAFNSWLRSNPDHRRRFLQAVALDQDLRRASQLPQLLGQRAVSTSILIIAAVLLVCACLLVWAAIAKKSSPNDQTPITKSGTVNSPTQIVSLGHWQLHDVVIQEHQLSYHAGVHPDGKDLQAYVVTATDTAGTIAGPAGTMTLTPHSRLQLASVHAQRPEADDHLTFTLLQGTLRLQPAPPQPVALLPTMLQIQTIHGAIQADGRLELKVRRKPDAIHIRQYTGASTWHSNTGRKYKIRAGTEVIIKEGARTNSIDMQTRTLPTGDQP